MIICQITHLACFRKTALKWAECNSAWVREDAMTNGSDLIAWNYAHKMVRALLWSHCFSAVPICGRTWTTYVRLLEFGPRSVNLWATTTVTHRMHFSSWIQMQEFGKQFWQSIRIGYSLLTFVITKKKYLKYQFKRQKWLLCMRSNCLSKKYQQDFFFFITYLNTYLQNSGFSLLGGKKGIKNTLYINMYDM